MGLRAGIYKRLGGGAFIGYSVPLGSRRKPEPVGRRVVRLRLPPLGWAHAALLVAVVFVIACLNYHP
jgi:hypothetical protein